MQLIWKMGVANVDISLLGTVCKPFNNGLQCANCEMQVEKYRGIEYVQILPHNDPHANIYFV